MRKKDLLAPVLLALLVFVAFYPTLLSDFVAWDDPENLIQNHAYRGLSWTHLTWMFTTYHLGIYIPMTWVTYGLDYVLWGMNPFGYHLTNVLLHIGNTVLVYVLILRLWHKPKSTSVVWAAFFAAGFFGLHPLRVESVAWVTERKDVLSVFFLLLSILFYLQHRRIASWGVYLLSLLAKPMAVTMPALLLIIDLYQFARDNPKPTNWRAFPWKPKLLDKLPYVLLAIPIVCSTLYGVKRHGLIAPIESFDLLMRLSAMSNSLLFYIGKSFWPFDLGPLYPLPELRTLHGWPYTGYIAVVVLLTIFAIRFYRKNPSALLAWSWYGISLLPVSGILQSGGQLIAERYSYVPTLSLTMIIGWIILRAEAGEPQRRRLARVGGVCVLCGFLALTYIQTHVWTNTLTFWQAVILKNPRSNTKHNNLGASLAEKGRIEEAIHYFRITLAIDPEHKGAQKNLRRALKLSQSRSEKH